MLRDQLRMQLLTGSLPMFPPAIGYRYPFPPQWMAQPFAPYPQPMAVPVPRATSPTGTPARETLAYCVAMWKRACVSKWLCACL